MPKLAWNCKFHRKKKERSIQWFFPGMPLNWRRRALLTQIEIFLEPKSSPQTRQKPGLWTKMAFLTANSRSLACSRGMGAHAVAYRKSMFCHSLHRLQTLPKRRIQARKIQQLIKRSSSVVFALWGSNHNINDGNFNNVGPNYLIFLDPIPLRWSHKSLRLSTPAGTFSA